MPWLAHEHGHVRREALRLALRFRGLRDRALAAALADTDERVLSLALRAVLSEPARGVTRLLFDLTGRDTLSDELRALAVEALVRVNRDPAVADRLLEIVTRDSRWLAWGGQETGNRTSIAALSALATHWPSNQRVDAVVRRAAASPSPDVRLAVRSERP
jgi:predicted Zn-dependent protease